MKRAVETLSVLKLSILVPIIFSIVAIGNGLIVENDELVKAKAPAASASQMSSSSSTVYKQLYLTDPNHALDRIDPVATSDNSTVTSPIIEDQLSVIKVVSPATFWEVPQNWPWPNFAVNYNTGNSGEDRLLIVGISYVNNQGIEEVTSVTYAGVSMNRAVGEYIANKGYSVIYSLVNPPMGDHQIAIEWNTTIEKGAVIGAVVFEGVDQTAPIANTAANEETGPNPNVTITSANDQVVVGVATGSPTNNYAIINSGTELWNFLSVPNQLNGVAQYQQGATSNTLEWTSNLSPFSAVAVSLKPIDVMEEITFTQNPAMCSDFVVEQELLSITTHIDVLTGTMPNNPNIAAELFINSNNIITIGNPSYDIVTGTLNWSGIPNNTVVPAGSSIELKIKCLQPGVTFQVLYDSKTYPSVIDIPTQTYIEILDFDIYDAPYPGGNIVVEPDLNSTVYFRSTVADPFGADDITSLDIDIDGVLYPASAVNTVGCTKTYEYVWNTPSAPNAFDITAIAREGFEELVTDDSTKFVIVCEVKGAQPVFGLGTTSERCMGASSSKYTASSNSSEIINYSLDAASLAGGNTIGLLSGLVTFDPAWINNSIVTASIDECGTTLTSEHLIVTHSSVDSPVFDLDSTSMRCEGADILTYTATSNNADNILYEIDAASVAAGNTINQFTGAVTFLEDWSSPTTITATAHKCGFTSQSNHVVTNNPSVGLPIFDLGLNSTYCQEAGSEIYTAASTHSTDISYYLDGNSLAAGNLIDPATGEITFHQDWIGTSFVTASATGCNGPIEAMHEINIIGNGIATFDMGDTTVRLSAQESIVYNAVSNNGSPVDYSIDPVSLAGGVVINSTSGEVVFPEQWIGVSFITAATSGCNGVQTQIHTIVTNTSVIYKQLYLSDTNQGLDRLDPVGTSDGTSLNSPTLQNQYTPIKVGQHSVYNVPETWPWTNFGVNFDTGTRWADKVLIVGISYRNNAGTEEIDYVTYGGIEMTREVGQANTNEGYAAIYSLTNPPSGPNDLFVQWNSTIDDGAFIGAMVFEGVNQTTPIVGSASNQGIDSNPNIAISATSEQLVVGVICGAPDSSYNIVSPGIEIWSELPITGELASSALYQSGSPTTSVEWTSNSADFAAVAVTLQPSEILNELSFTQSTPMCTDFIIEEDLLTIESYIYVVSDSVPNNLNISAELSFNSTPIITLNNPIYDAASGMLRWSGVPDSVITVLAGSEVELKITSLEPILAYQLLYDSYLYPSRINLPTETYIEVSSFEMYDAPYPGGNLIEYPDANTTVYIRNQVDDPFGADDITGLDINYLGVSNSAAPIATNGCTKTYEYPWTTPSVNGTYAIMATAKEGYENTVTDDSTMIVTICNGSGYVLKFDAGEYSERCQEASSGIYEATSTAANPIIYSLDAVSLAAGNTIDSLIGVVTYLDSWSDTSYITATTLACGDTISEIHLAYTDPAVVVPIFNAGPTSVRCEGTETIIYDAVSIDADSIVYTLDPASIAGGVSIDAQTGAVNYISGWTNNTVITATAYKCSYTKQSTHEVTNTGNLEAPVFDLGTYSTYCQGAGSVIYNATATNSSSLSYFLDGNSLAAGNTFDAATGTITFHPDWHGNSFIVALADGCSGPLNTTHVVEVIPNGVAMFDLGETSQRYSATESMVYNATSNAGATITYSLDNISLAAGVTINSITGEVNFPSSWVGQSQIFATTNGCNGTQVSNHIVTTSQTYVYKQLYLSDPNKSLDRIDPVATSDPTSAKGNLSGFTVINDNALDLFNNNTFSGNDGTQNFSTNWQELGENDGPTNGQVQIINSGNCAAGNCLRFGGFNLNINGDGAVRSADLSSATSWAFLNFRYFRTGVGGSNAVIDLEISDDGGTSWTTLNTYNMNTIDPGQIVESIDIANYISSNTQFRFVGSGTTSLLSSWIYFDNIEIAYQTQEGASTIDFTQSPQLCDDLIIVENELIHVNTYVNVLSGSMPANPAITATISYGGTNLAVLENPTFDNATNLISWSQLMPTNVQVPAGQALALEISTTDINLDFQIFYDSQTYPSRIELPVSTFIEVTTFEYFDAPYPNGNSITEALTSSTYYMRAEVTDPFGYEDITALNFDINGSIFSGIPVDSFGCTKIYEMANVASNMADTLIGTAIALEGYEGTVESEFTNNLFVCGPLVTTPIFEFGESRYRCIGADEVVYTVFVDHQDQLIYSLDEASLIGGVEVDTLSGKVVFPSNWSDTSFVTATAYGCGGPTSSTHTIITLDSVAAPTFLLGTTSTRCQGSESIVYEVTSPDSFYVRYTLDQISLQAGNNVDSLTGLVNYEEDWKGESEITATSYGCHGSIATSHIVTTTPYVTTPVFNIGSSSTYCPLDTSIVYSASAENETHIEYFLDAESLEAGMTIDTTTGRVNFDLGYTGAVTIKATAFGCDGPKTGKHVVEISLICPPTAVDDYILIDVGESAFKDVLENDYDVNGDMDPSTLSIVHQPTNGTATVAIGEVIYSPTGNYIGTDKFVYEICDIAGNCVQATVFVTIQENLLDPCAQANQIQEFYLPFPEDHLYHAFRDASCNTGEHSSEVRSVIAIKTPYPTIYIKYDHWEDGYETDLSVPMQATTEIWGDGNLTNGIAPGHPNDILLAGSSIILDNTFDYTPPRDPSVIAFDGKDKIVTSSDVTISKISGDQSVFLLQAAKTSIYDTDRFGTTFTIPFGEDLGKEFQYTALFIRAMKDSTFVTVDVNGDGTQDPYDEIAMLNEGEVMFVEGDPDNVNQFNDIKSGALVTSSEKVGLDILFGGLDCYGTRNINLQPASFYSATYYTPVPTVAADAPATVYFYNKYDYDMTINWSSNAGNGSFVIPSNSPLAVLLPELQTAYKFENLAGESFVAMEVIDSDTDGAAFDWAFALTGSEQLSDFTSIAWAPGSSDGSRNDCPIWVTPTGNTTLYVKLDGDVTSGGPNLAPCGRSYDFAQPLTEFEAYRILDNNDNDQSGIAMFTCDSTTFFSVYGEDPSTALPGAPSMDVGTTMEPLCSERLILANEDVASTPIGIPIDIPVLENDASFLATIDPNKLYTSTLLQPLNGTHTIDPITHRIIYTPDPGWEGIEYFEYQICSVEDDLLCDVALVSVYVGNCNANEITVVASGFTYYESIPDNGAYDGETTIPNVDVSLYWDDNGNGEIDAPLDTLILSTISNISGYYEFNFRLLGDFVIEVNENNGGYAPGTLRAVSVSFSSLGSCVNNLYLGLSPIVDPIDDNYTTFVNTDLSENLLLNDLGDINPNSFASSGLMPTNGTVNFNASGNFDYQPNLDFLGVDSFNYQVCSNFDPNLCDTAMVVINIVCPNLAGSNLITGTVFYDINQNGIYDIGDTGQESANVLLYLDSNQDGLLDASDVLQSAVLTAADGTYVFSTTPADYIMVLERTSVAGTYMTTDNIETAHFTAVGQSDCTNNFGLKDCVGSCPPEAIDDQATTEVAQSVIVDVLLNDYDADGDLDPTSVTIPSNSPLPNGVLSIDPINGAITYDPNPSFSGLDTFYYSVCDQSLPTIKCDTATVFISVTCPEAAGQNLISGFVFLDSNADEIFQTTESGASNIQVLLHEDLNQNGVLDAADITIDSVNSDGNGHFQFSLLGNSPPQTITRNISAWSDDAEEVLFNGDMYLTENFYALGHYAGDSEIVGLRFRNISIPQNANILNAYIEFSAAGNTGQATNFTFYCQDVNNSPAFVNTNYNISNRVKTSASVSWNNVPQWVGGNIYQTPDLSAIVQEVILRPGWNQGNRLSFLIEGGPGNRYASSFESGSGPTLVIEYEEVATYGTHFVTSINVNTLPIGTEMTTDNIEAAMFDDLIQSDCSNHFGFRNCPGGCQPMAVNDTTTTQVSTAVIIDVLANDYDADFDLDPSTVAITQNSPTPNGNLTINPTDGSITYTPYSIFSGVDSFYYEVCDQSTPVIKCDTATIFVTVNCLDFPGQNVISGYVFEDVNANASYQINENAASNIKVVLHEDLNQNGLLDAGDMPIDSVNSDANGFYQFSMPSTGLQQFDLRNLSSGANDSEESLVSGQVLLGGNDLGLGHDGDLQLVGLRFNNINIPNNSNILSARLEFYADGSSTENTDLEVYCEAADNSPIFTSNNFDLTSRAKTNASIAWDNVSNWADNNWYPTPDLSTIVEEVIARPGWVQGNNLSFLIEGGPGRRRAETFESTSGPAARLILQYQEISPDGTHFVTSIAVNAIPDGAEMTTNITEAAVFDEFIHSDCGNNFGYNFFSLNPLALGDINATEVNNNVFGNVLTNDQAARGYDFKVQPFDIENGTVVISANGDYTFTPELNYAGEASFKYEICDAIYPLLCDTAIVSIDIIDCLSNGNNQVIGLEDHFIHENQKNLISDLLANDHDPEGDNLLINTTAISLPSKGSLAINPDGTFFYKPIPGSINTDEFTYEVCDDAIPHACDTVVVNIHLYDSNGEANIYATDDAYLTEMEDTISANLLLNDNLSNVSNFVVETIPVVAPENGELTLNADGSFEYIPDETFIGNDQFLYKICDNISSSSCDTATVYLTVLDNRIKLDFKIMLQGALYGTTDSLMRADLVEQNLVPLVQPYSTAFNPLYANRLTHSTGGDETTTNAILQANAGTKDAIVDWVFIELRDPVDTITVLRTISALVQRDGDIVDAKSGGNLYEKDLIGQFFVCIKHRNHLGVMTASPISVFNKTATVDFTAMNGSSLFHFDGYEGLEQTSYNGLNVMWAGNANADSKIKYDGTLNDRIILVGEIINAPGNVDSNLNYNNAIGYYQGDVNMDGKAKYDGVLNDRILMQYIVLTYTNNSALLNNFDLLIEQVK